MTILDFLRNNPGKHTCETIAKAIGASPFATRLVLTWFVQFKHVIGHEQNGACVYEHKEPNTLAPETMRSDSRDCVPEGEETMNTVDHYLCNNPRAAMPVDGDRPHNAAQASGAPIYWRCNWVTFSQQNGFADYRCLDGSTIEVHDGEDWRRSRKRSVFSLDSCRDRSRCNADGTPLAQPLTQAPDTRETSGVAEPLKVDDWIEILQDGANCADVKRDDVLMVDRIDGDGSFRTAGRLGWWFQLRDEGINFRRVPPPSEQVESDTCGIGSRLPSGACDHCNQPIVDELLDEMKRKDKRIAELECRINELGSKTWEDNARFGRLFRKCEIAKRELVATRQELAEAKVGLNGKKLPCGHSSSSAITCVESGDYWCGECDMRSRLSDALQMEKHNKAQWETEKRQRLYYQGIVFDVCQMIDDQLGHTPGQGVVCGTSAMPSQMTQRELKKLLDSRLDCIAEMHGLIAEKNQLSDKLAAAEAKAARFDELRKVLRENTNTTGGRLVYNPPASKTVDGLNEILISIRDGGAA